AMRGSANASSNSRRSRSATSLIFEPLARSQRASTGAQLGAAELEERLAGEAAAEEDDAGGVLAGEELERLRDRAARRRQVAAPLGDQAQVEPRHRERRVEVDRGLVVLDGGGEVALVIARQRHEVVGAGVELVALEEAAADLLGVAEAAGVGEEDGAEELRVGILDGGGGKPARQVPVLDLAAALALEELEALGDLARGRRRARRRRGLGQRRHARRGATDGAGPVGLAVLALLVVAVALIIEGLVRVAQVNVLGDPAQV